MSFLIYRKISAWPRTDLGRLFCRWIGNGAAIVLVVPILVSCATNSALTLMGASKQDELIVPTQPDVRAHLKDRAISLGKIYFDLDSPLTGPEGLKGETYLRLIQYQIEKGFRAARVSREQVSANFIDIAVEHLKFTSGTFLVPNPSILRMRIEVRTSSETALMKGSVESRYLPTVPIMAVPGIITPVATTFEGQDYVAVSKTIPALALVCTRIALGLQEGKTLDEIEIYPHAYSAGGYVSPDAFLEDEPFGFKALTKDEIANANRMNGRKQ